MEPNRELPPVERSESPANALGVEAPTVMPEITGNVVQPGPLSTTQQQSPLPGPNPMTLQPPTGSVAGQVMPMSDDTMIADDTDLIEKEWVSRAKDIVEQTKHDPHAQNQEISKIKARYVKQRYNKDLKVDTN